MTVQKTDWGQIQWTNDKDDLISIEGLKVGMVTLNTGAHQERHIHFEEQVLYVVQGTAVSKVGKEQIEMKPGQYYHWPAGVLHEVWNTGDLPFRHLLVANANFEDEWLIQEDEEAGEQRSLSEREVQDQARQAGAKRLVSPDLIYGAVEAIRTQFLENIHYSYVIFDTAGNVVIQSERYPAYCNRCCRPQENSGSCPCMVRLTSEEKEEEQSFRCPFGMEVFHNPIRFHQTTIGYIQSGYIRHAYGEKDNVQSVYDVPESVVAGIRALIRRIVKAIRNYCEFEQFRRDLTERELRIATGEETRQILMKNLKDAEYAMTDLKINNHFLFNTLNSMASMAVECGAMPLYQSIVDLSKMFHYTQRTQSSMVVLTKEIEYVNAYLKLQKLRYGDSLQVQWEIDPRLENVSVPFNFL